MSYTRAEKERMRSGLVTALVAFVFYICAAWVITIIIDVEAIKFWWIVLGLASLELVQLIINFCIGWVVWRIYGRHRAIALYLEDMRKGKLPKRVYQHDRIDGFLDRIVSPSSVDYKRGEITSDIQKVAAALNQILMSVRDQHGMFAEIRTWDAMESALDIYSPEDEAPPFVSPGMLYSFRDIFTERELLSMPHMTPEIVKGLIVDRPYETLGDLYQYLISRQLDRDQAGLFLIATSQLHDANGHGHHGFGRGGS